MTTPRHILVRSARNRIIDLLGIGETYPLEDVAVQSEQLTVSVRQRTSFAIEPGEEGVLYELYDGNDPVDPDVCSVFGTGAKTVLPGPIVTGDRTFRIHAVNVIEDFFHQSRRDDFLHQSASVKVGLDTQLRAVLDLPPLNPDLPSPGDAAPRIADHGSIVRVIVAGAQAEASYQLVYAGRGGLEVTTAPVPSSGGDLVLLTQPVEEDTVIRIRATRMTGPPDTALLAAALPLAVRADPALAAAIAGSPLVDPGGPVAITLAASQASVAYSVYARVLGDRDFIGDDASPANALTVPVPASLDVPEHEVRVRAPARPTPWDVQPGFVRVGGPTQGNAGDLTIPVAAFVADTVLVIRAHKEHFAAGIPGMPMSSGPSDVQLERAVVALARPDAAPALELTVPADSDGKRGPMEVSGGQRGVFYHFRMEPSGDEIGLPAYFHRLDEDDPRQNRGIGQLAIENDLAIARDSWFAATLSPELTPPPDPVVEVAPLPGGEVSVMAVFARTRVGWLSSQLFGVGRT